MTEEAKRRRKQLDHDRYMRNHEKRLEDARIYRRKNRQKIIDWHRAYRDRKRNECIENLARNLSIKSEES